MGSICVALWRGIRVFFIGKSKSEQVGLSCEVRRAKQESQNVYWTTYFHISMRTSYSALETFLQCPQKYKFQEIDKIKAPKSKEAVFGTLVHDALKYMFSRDPLFPTAEQVLTHFREGLEKSKTVFTDDEKNIYSTSGQNILKKFYTKNPPWNFTVVDLESFFEVPIADEKTGATHVLAGKIDRIDKTEDGSYEIIDYKTSRKLPPQAEVDQNLQLSLYHMGLLRRWPHIDPHTIRLSLYFLKAQEKLVTSRTKEALAETRAKTLAIINEIEQKRKTSDPKAFPPTPSALCNWCAYKPICPAWKHLYQNQKSNIKNQNLLGEVDIKQIIKEYFNTKDADTKNKKRLGELTDHIHAYLDKEGLERVFGDEGSILRKTSERASWDTDKLRPVLLELGLWEQVAAPDTKKVKALLPSLPHEAQAKLAEAKIIKISLILTASKKKVE